jgi:hypothetical protein
LTATAEEQEEKEEKEQNQESKEIQRLSKELNKDYIKLSSDDGRIEYVYDDD